MSELTALTLHETRDLLRQGQVSSVEVTQAYLDRIDILDDSIKAYLHLAPEMALTQAAEADERRSSGADNALLGIPLAIKDMITLQDMPATAASHRR